MKACLLKRMQCVFIVVAGVAVVLVLLGVSRYRAVLLTPNIGVEKGKTALNIPEDGWTTEDVLAALSAKVEVRDERSLRTAMKRLDYETVRSGHYVLVDGMNNKELVDMLRRGLQTPVRVTLNNLRTKADLASSLARQLMPDSAAFMAVLDDSVFLAGYGLNRDNVLVAFIPDTYEFFWNTDARRVFGRMYKAYARFWTEGRLAKAADIPLAPVEVSILASIVEEETNRRDEYPVVAGLYINRLKRGMLLQADPTVKFAVGDFALRRVLKAHLETDSPYNTYKYKGLPPGPIRIPTARSIDAVLDYSKHNYLYMVAKETLNGEHCFSTNLRDHNNNARRYQRALNQLRIYH